MLKYVIVGGHSSTSYPRESVHMYVGHCFMHVCKTCVSACLVMR